MFGRKKRSASTSWLCTQEAYETLCATGYTRLSDNPEVKMAVRRIAELVSSMTIHLMQNTPHGDVRLKDELAKKIDISPGKDMTRKTLIHTIVRTLLLEGGGNAVVQPVTRDGLLDYLRPIPPSKVAFEENGDSYRIRYNGVAYPPDAFLHFVLYPDPEHPWKGEGCRAELKDVVQNLRQAAATKKGFMESKWKPSIVLKVDGLTEEFASKEGRAKLLEQYIATSQAGEPWMVPAEQFDIQQIKPLTLQDLALNDSVLIDKKTVAAVLGVPPFVVGAGAYSDKEWNNFINSYILPIARAIEQELTRKLLLAPDRYFRFNPRALYAYDMRDLSDIGQELYVRGIMTGNEARDWIGMPPLEGLDERVILENYIPAGMIGDQKKLNQDGGKNDSDTGKG